MADSREDDTISEGLISTPTKGLQPVKERIGINARSNMTKFTGHTPLVFINNVTQRCNAAIVCKLEDRSPAEGPADRVALAIVNKLESQKAITPGRTTLVEATSSGGGTGLALIGAIKGYKVVCVIQDSVPVEKRVLARAYGAEVVVTPTSKGMKGVLFKAQQIVEDRPYSVLINPWEDATNVEVHRELTGMEIWEDTHGQVDVFVAPVNTGGTITGVGRCLKARKPGCLIVAVEPSDSPTVGGSKAVHANSKLQELGATVAPPLLDLSVVDEVFKVSAEQGAQMAKNLARREGLFAGQAGGAAVFAAIEIARRPDMHGKLVVAMVASPATHSLSTLYEDLRRQCQSLTICRESEFRNMPKDKARSEKADSISP